MKKVCKIKKATYICTVIKDIATMKTFSPNDSEKIKTEKEKVRFIKWMAEEYPSYIVIEAHNESDFENFVSEFIKSNPDYKS